MSRKKQLVYCRMCTNREFDSKQGLICNLTGKVSDFDETCNDFNKDEEVIERAEEEQEEQSNLEVINSLNDKAIQKLRSHQDFYYALLGGTLIALISAVIWAVITVSIEYQVGYMAIGVGLLVGFGVRFYGAGIDNKFGILGAVLALVGCLLGNLLSQVGFIAQAEGLGYFETLTYLDLNIIVNIMAESFHPMDVLFYGIGIYEGFKFAFRKVSVQEMSKLQSDDYEAYPSNAKLRMPLVVVSAILIGFVFFMINLGVSGFKTFSYESGLKMSEGEMKNSKEDGEWTYYFESGELQSKGNYNKGIPNGLWLWYYQSGNLVRTGNYKNGLEHGLWMSYYDNGSPTDSFTYIDGRIDGDIKTWFQNGQLFQTGSYSKGLQVGEWKTYFENGILSSKGEMLDGVSSGLWRNYYEDGKLSNEINFLANDKTTILNAWNPRGKQLVKDGNGTYQGYSARGDLLLTGEINDGVRVGKWTSYHDDGKKKEEGIYKSDIYSINNSWNEDGIQIVTDGNGRYKSFYADGKTIFESGLINNGLREGNWTIYFESNGTVQQEQSYVSGNLDGTLNIYFETGSIYATGIMNKGFEEGEWNWYYENGSLQSTVRFANGKKEGSQIMWSQVGDKTKEEIYEHGKLIQENLL